MSFVNLGGPGWFQDVFEVEINVDTTDRVKTRACNSFPVYKSYDKVTGKVKLISPPNRSVWHYGLTIKIESSTSFFKTMRTLDEEVTALYVLHKGEYVTGSAEYAFELDLTQVDLPIPDSIDGELFALRQWLTVSISRPWYTCDVIKQQPLVINRIDAAPANGKALAPDGSLVLPETEASKDPYMKLLDCGGSVTLDYERSAFNIGDTLKGDVIVTDVPLDVQFIRVEFFKIEKGDNDECETIIRHEVAYQSDPRPPSTPKPTPHTAEEGDATDAAAAATAGEVEVELTTVEGEEGAKDESAAAAVTVDDTAVKPANESDDAPPSPPAGSPPTLMTGKTFPIALLLDGTSVGSVGPTYYAFSDSPDELSVHYYIRLMITDWRNNTYWNTHEIAVHRATLGNMTQVDV